MRLPFKPQHPLLDKPFYARGRFGRLSFAAWSCLVSMMFLSAIFLLEFCVWLVWRDTRPQLIEYIDSVFIAALSCIYFYYILIIMIRRLHDCNHSSWLTLLLFVPGLNIVFIFYLLLMRGNQALNAYGYPRNMYGWEKILGLCLIIFLLLMLLILSVFFILFMHNQPVFF